MAGVLGQFNWPFSRKGEIFRPRFVPVDPSVLELEVAKEILAEVFLIDVVEVEEMIRQRCEDGLLLKDPAVWPEELWVEDRADPKEMGLFGSGQRHMPH
jgi:hypothetical protein